MALEQKYYPLGVCNIFLDDENIGFTLRSKSVIINTQTFKTNVLSDERVGTLGSINNGHNAVANFSVPVTKENLELFVAGEKLTGELRFKTIDGNSQFTLYDSVMTINYSINSKTNSLSSIDITATAILQEDGELINYQEGLFIPSEFDDYVQLGYQFGGGLSEQTQLLDETVYSANDGLKYINIGGYRDWTLGEGEPDELFLEATLRGIYNYLNQKIGELDNKFNQYLPLSGGTINGELLVNGRLSGSLRHTNGYFEMLPYNNDEHNSDDSFAQYFYTSKDGIRRVLQTGKASDDTNVPITNQLSGTYTATENIILGGLLEFSNDVLIRRVSENILIADGINTVLSKSLSEPVGGIYFRPNGSDSTLYQGTIVSDQVENTLKLRPQSANVIWDIGFDGGSTGAGGKSLLLFEERQTTGTGDNWCNIVMSQGQDIGAYGTNEIHFYTSIRRTLNSTSHWRIRNRDFETDDTPEIILTTEAVDDDVIIRVYLRPKPYSKGGLTIRSATNASVKIQDGIYVSVDSSRWTDILGTPVYSTLNNVPSATRLDIGNVQATGDVTGFLGQALARTEDQIKDEIVAVQLKIDKFVLNGWDTTDLNTELIDLQNELATF